MSPSGFSRVFPGLLVLVLLGVAPSLRAQEKGESLDDLTRRARAAWSSRDYGAAAEALTALVARDAENSSAWYRLGYALHFQGRLDEALKAHVKAAEFPETCGLASYNAACVHALGESAKLTRRRPLRAPPRARHGARLGPGR